VTELVLSMFPGVGLLDRGFEETGFCVVRGPDLIFGGDIFKFHAAAGHFSGVIGGPPCQKFSLSNRNRDIAGGMVLVNEYLRVIDESQPEWALMENVAGSPIVSIPGFTCQVFTLNALHCGSSQHRLRKFHFFHRPGTRPLVLRRDRSQRAGDRTCMASEGRRVNRRSWAEFCALQGLPAGFDLPSFKMTEKYRAVGNGVPFPMALMLAQSIRDRARHTGHTLCECGCGEPVFGKARLASPACRKRQQRLRDSGQLPAVGASQLALV
jgi:DNA (cytosine-5)-methyltransferase 1